MFCFLYLTVWGRLRAADSPCDSDGLHLVKASLTIADWSVTSKQNANRRRRLLQFSNIVGNRSLPQGARVLSGKD
jgi:hypothetical protein